GWSITRWRTIGGSRPTWASITWCWRKSRRRRRPPEAAFGLSRECASSHRRNAVEEAGDGGDTAVFEPGEIGALDRRIDIVAGPQRPGEADIFAVAVRLAGEAEAVVGELLLHPGDQGVDVGHSPARHHGIDIARLLQPILGQEPAADSRIGFVPEGDIAIGDQLGIGHFMSPFSISPS